MGGQINATLVDHDDSNMVPIIGNSDDGGIEILTIASNVANGADQVCRSALIWTDGSDVTMKIDSGLTAADADDFLLLANQYLPVPVSNVNLIRLYGGTDGKKIYVLWRS